MYIDENWKFYRGDLAPHSQTDGWGGAKARAYFKGVPSFEFDDSGWREVSIPHDYVSESDYCFQKNGHSDMIDIPEMESIDSRLYAGGCLEGGVAWYRKRFVLPKNSKKRVYLHFDGVYRDCSVYLNQYYVGHHESGYGAFYYDISDFVDFEGENILAVRVDSRGREGWWYEGGGIYRHVRLEITDHIHIAPYGVHAYARKVDIKNKTAEINVKIHAINKTDADAEVVSTVELYDPFGTLAAKKETVLNIAAWDSCFHTFDLVPDSIMLWDLESPDMQYTAKVTVGDSEHSVKFGIREMRFDSKQGCFLNGTHIKIKGVCCHNDFAGVGIAATDSLKAELVKIIKHMGANAIRLSHYPPSAELLSICDSMGILVFSEVRRMSSAPEDLETLRMMVLQGRNHPSVFLWGIGNEEVFSQHRPETVRTTMTMKAEIKKLDPTRPITAAVVCWDGVKRYDNAEIYVNVTKNLDVMGFNYCQTAWDDYHERMPNQPVIITEESANGSTRGCYETEEALGRYFPFDKDNALKCKVGSKADRFELGEKAWKAVAERDYIAGTFIWTAFDYRGEPTPLKGNVISSQFGVLDYCGFPKDGYYYYASWWSDRDILHIFPNGSRALHNKPVYCYSNMDEVELFVNDISYGRQKVVRNWYNTWENVSCNAGELIIKGYKNGILLKEENAKAFGAPYKITAVCENDVKTGDTAVLTISILDENNNLVADACNRLDFEVTGGKFIGSGNGNPADLDNEKKLSRRAFGGLCRVLLKVEKNDMTLKVRETQAGLEGEIFINADKDSVNNFAQNLS